MSDWNMVEISERNEINNSHLSCHQLYTNNVRKIWSEVRSGLPESPQAPNGPLSSLKSQSQFLAFYLRSHAGSSQCALFLTSSEKFFHFVLKRLQVLLR